MPPLHGRHDGGPSGTSQVIPVKCAWDGARGKRGVETRRGAAKASSFSRVSSNASERVLDAFAGSGSTAAVARAGPPRHRARPAPPGDGGAATRRASVTRPAQPFSLLPRAAPRGD